MFIQKSSRREFIKSFFLAACVLPLSGLLKTASAAKSPAKPPAKAEPLPAGAVAEPESDPVASTIGYKANVKDIDFAKYPMRKKPEAMSQRCNGCALYTQVNGSWGKCQMLTAGLVASEGWCGSWSKKT